MPLIVLLTDFFSDLYDIVKYFSGTTSAELPLARIWNEGRSISELRWFIVTQKGDGARMTLYLEGLTFDCTSPALLARFWADILGYQVTELDERHAEIVDPVGKRMLLHFQRVAEGKAVKNRFHPDLHCDDLDAELAHLLRLGARVLQRFDEDTGRRRIIADPEGNEFCVEGHRLPAKRNEREAADIAGWTAR